MNNAQVIDAPYHIYPSFNNSVLYNADCYEAMKRMPENSIDSIVTDPPYGIMFQGNNWDKSVPGKEIWEQCLRVLKPGGHMLAFSGTRTYHRLVTNIEDAGFDIRDTCVWVYGSGMPKSMDIGIAIDKMRKVERRVIGYRNYTAADITSSSYASEDSKQRPRVPVKITKGDSGWDGWGTALKPACELICLARKPISEKNIAENVIKWGTGGINIDACRVPLTGREQPNGSAKRIYSNNKYNKDAEYGDNTNTPEEGRFPANFLHDGSQMVLDLFPYTRSGNNCTRTKPGTFLKNGGLGNAGDVQTTYGDKGSASRFFMTTRYTNLDKVFYVKKASQHEKNAGCSQGNKHTTVKPIELMRYLIRMITPPNGIVMDPFVGSGTTAIAAHMENCGSFVAIELDVDYYNVATQRIDHYQRLAIEEACTNN